MFHEDLGIDTTRAAYALRQAESLASRHKHIFGYAPPMPGDIVEVYEEPGYVRAAEATSDLLDYIKDLTAAIAAAISRGHHGR